MRRIGAIVYYVLMVPLYAAERLETFQLGNDQDFSAPSLCQYCGQPLLGPYCDECAQGQGASRTCIYCQKEKITTGVLCKICQDLFNTSAQAVLGNEAVLQYDTAGPAGDGEHQGSEARADDDILLKRPLRKTLAWQRAQDICKIDDKWLCPTCERSIVGSRTYLIYHLLTHTGEKPYQCDYPGCGKSFVRPSSLTTHKQTHTDEKLHQCDYPECEQFFTRYRSLRRHKLRKHSVVLPAGKPGKLPKRKIDALIAKAAESTR